MYQTHLHLAAHLARRIHSRVRIAYDRVVLSRVHAGEGSRRACDAREARLARPRGLANVASRPGPAVLARAGGQVREW